MKNILSRKFFHIIIIIVIIVALLFAVGISMLKYEVEGETYLPFEISKISIISSTEAIDKQENTQNKWDLSVNQNNDIYIYIEKNPEYKKTEIIDTIKLDNFNITNKNEVGTSTIYKPQEQEVAIFKNSEDNKVTEIEYKGEQESDVKKLKISNQGGLIVFRIAKDNISEYISDSDEEIKYNELLSKTNVKIEDLKIEVTFDITIRLNSGKVYKAPITLNLPTEDIIEKGMSSKEITELDDIIFKRIEN